MQACQLSEGKNVIKKGQIVFVEGDTAEKFGIVLQGKFDVLLGKKGFVQGTSYYKVAEIGSSSFIGVNGAIEGEYIYTYIAAEDSIIYIYPSGNVKSVRDLLEVKKEYSEYIIASSLEMFGEIYKLLDMIKKNESLVTVFKEKLILYYFYLKENLKIDRKEKMTYLEEREKWYTKVSFSSQAEDFKDVDYKFFLKDIKSIYTDVKKNNELVTKIEYFEYMVKNGGKEFEKLLTLNEIATSYNVGQVSDALMELKEEIAESIDFVKKEFGIIFNNTDENLYCEFIELGKAAKKENAKILKVLEYIMQMAKAFLEDTKEILGFDEPEYILKQMNLLYKNLVNGEEETEETVEKSDRIDLSTVRLNAQGIPIELENSLSKILEYSEISLDVATIFKAYVQEFINTKDKNSNEGELRKIKAYIGEAFFDIYQAVFKRVVKENNNDRIYNMFLNYSYMDERLLTKEEILELYCMPDKFEDCQYCNIYSARRWLEAIYNGEREPSLNEFDMDYYDTFRELKRTKKVTDRDKEKYDRDQDAKINFEIINYIKKNQRLCYGQASSYFPILCSENIVGSFERGYVSFEKLSESFKKLKEIDFSLFYRESFCHAPERGLEKYYYQREVVPDIILLPTFGLKSIMWQPIAMRDRNKPARFSFPIFTCENLDNMVTRCSGTYRWEMCKSVMGTAWSDITQKSLTSEYADYIQFYRKNSDLSNEAKEKIKDLMVKSRNMLKEAFATDYETWIRYESTGAVRLNKVVRAIMYNYCPFSKEIRERLQGQVAFAEAANMYNRAKVKKVKDIELRISKLDKTKAGVPSELMSDLIFYRDL